MSRWRAAPPSTSLVGWEQLPRPYPLQGHSRLDVPFTRLSHYSSPLSLAAYRLIGPNDVSSTPTSPQSYDQSYSIVPRSQPTLPVELYRHIIQYVTSQHDLCTLTRVSRAFQAEAERVLYHSIQLRHQIKTMWRCESLATQPRLALYVRKLSIIIDQYTPMDSIARALKACSGLRYLALRGAPWSDYSKVLDAVSSTGITEFTCHAGGEAGVVRFLERQTNLEEIDFEAHGFDLDNLSPYAVPNLRVFRGWLATAATIVPGRSVKQLALTSDMATDGTIRAVNRLADSKGDIMALELRTGVLRNPISWCIVENILMSLKGLRFLGVCSLECAKHPSFPFYIMGLPHLQTLVFGTGTDDYQKYDERLQHELVHKLGQSCESLSQVIITLAAWQHDWIWTRDSAHVMEWDQAWQSRGQEWWGMISNEPINLEELARLHVDSA